MTKKLLALVLSVLMLVSLLPVSALAAVVMPATVSTVADLQDALNNPSFNPVSLGADIQIKTSDGLTDNMFKVNRKVTLDLAGFSIDSICNSDYVISVDTDVLTLTNTGAKVSTVSGQDYKIAPVGVASGAELELDGALNISKVYLAENGKISKLGSTLNIASPITVISDSSIIPVEIIEDVNGYQETTTDFVSAVAGEEVAVYGDTAYLAKPQTITFNANGGEFSDPDAENPETLVIPWHLGFDWPDWLTLTGQSALPTRTGYNFAGIKNHGTTSYEFFDKTGAMKITSPGTAPGLYAEWEPLVYRARYNIGTTVEHSTTDRTYAPETTWNGRVPTSLPEGYSFGGWSVGTKGEAGYKEFPLVEGVVTITQDDVIGFVVYDETDGYVLDLNAILTLNGQRITLNTMAPDGSISEEEAAEAVKSIYKGNVVYTFSALYGSEFTVPSPTRPAGYTFKGWRVAGQSTMLEGNTITVTGDAGYQAEWEPITYKVGFEDGEGTGGMEGQEIELIYGHKVSDDQATLTAVPTRTGYVFNGYWSTAEDIEGATPGIQYFDKDGAAVANAYWLETDVDTLFARYAPTTFTIQLYKNDVNAGGISPVLMKNITYGSTVTLVDNPFTGFHAGFAGWNTKEAGDGDSYADKASIDTSTLTPIKIGDAYYFRLYAQWDAEQVKVTFDLGYEATSVPEPKLVAYNTAVGALPTVERDGYDFVGWFTDPADSHSQYDATNVITDPVTLIAKWIGKNITVTIDPANGKDEPLQWINPCGTGWAVEGPDAFGFHNKDGFVFDGWKDSKGKVYKVSTAEEPVIYTYPAAADTLTAIWVGAPVKITLRSPAGSVIEGATPVETEPNVIYEFDSAVGAQFTIPEITREGFAFKEWKNGSGTIFESPFEVTGAVTLYAQWAEDFTVNFYLNNGTTESAPYKTVTISSGTALGNEMPTAGAEGLTKEGYDFEGWYIDSADNAGLDGYKLSSDYPIDRSIDLYAYWTPIQFTVSFYKDASTVVVDGTKKYTIADSVVSPWTASEPGMTFMGWATKSGIQFPMGTDGKTPINFGTDGVAADIETVGDAKILKLYAYWDTVYPTFAKAPLHDNATTDPKADADLYTTYECGAPAADNTVTLTATDLAIHQNDAGDASTRQYWIGIGVEYHDDWTYAINGTSIEGADKKADFTEGGKGYLAIYFPAEEGQKDAFTLTVNGLTYQVKTDVTYATYTATLASGIEHGTATIETSPSTEGTFVKVVPAPATGYNVSKVTYQIGTADPVEITKDASGNYTFAQPGADVVITPEFTGAEISVYLKANLPKNAAGDETSSELKDMPGTIKVFVGGKYDTLTGTPSLAGYTFDGWKNRSGNVITSTSDVVNPQSHNLDAQWIANKYKVEFYGNKPGEATSDPVVSKTEIEVTFDQYYGELATATLTGFQFDGWFTEVDGGTKVEDTDLVTTANEQKLYAHWTENSSVKPIVSIDAPAELTYGYSADEAPVLTATIENRNDDVYDYTYTWYIKTDAGNESVGDKESFKVPSGLDNGLQAGTTNYYCTVTAQLKGSTTTQTSDEASVPVIVNKAQLTVDLWTTNSPAYNGKEQVVATLKVSPAVPQTSMHITVDGHDGTLIPNNDGSYSIKLRNAGDYTVTYKVDETPNYFSKVPSGTGDSVNIAPQVLDITWKSTQADGSFNYPYAGGYPITGVEIELGNIQENESGTPDTVNVTLSGNVETIPGNYTAKVSKPDNPNYVLPSIVEKPWNINYQTAEFKVEANDLTYNGSAQELVTATLVGCTIKYNEVGGTDGYYAQPITKTEERTYTVYYELTASTYYQIIPESARYGSVEVTIAPKPIQLTWGTTELTYTGDPQAPTCDVTSGYKCGSDTINVTVTGQQTNVGENYTASAVIDNHNYVIDPAFVETTFKIVSADIDKAEVEPGYTSAPYNGTEKTPGVKTATFNGHALVEGTDFDVSYQNNTEATDEAKMILAGKGNFTGTKTILFTITPRALTSIEKFEDVTYDGQDHKPATVKVYYTNAQNSEQVQVPTDLYDVVWTDANNQTVTVLKAPGTYTATITLKDTSVSFTGSLTTTLTIKPITLAFDWNGPWALTYNGTEQKISDEAHVKANNVLSGEDVTLVFSGNTETNVGNYKFTITDIDGADKANYVLPELGKREMTWSITPADIAPAAFTLSESEFTYTGTVQGPTIATAKITLDGVVDIASSDYTFTWVDENGNVATPQNAGKYYLAVSAKDGGNFTGTVTNRPFFTIKPASLTLTAKDDTWTYGTSFEGHLKVTPEGLVNGETLKTSDVTYGYQITKESTKYNVTDIPDVGDYGISIVNASSNNYAITPISGTLHVTQKELTVAEWTDTEVTFDGEAHAPTAVLEGIVNEDDVKAVVTTTKIDVNRDTAGNVIPYEGIEITLDGADKANYKMADGYTKGTLTILPRDIADANMSLEDDAPIYDGENQYPSVAAPVTIVLVPGDAPKTLVYNTDFTAGVDGESGSKDVGTTYNVKVTGIGNYTGERLLPFNVMPKPLTVNWGSEVAFTYNGNEQAPTATLNGVLADDTAKVVAVVEGKQINAGTDYTATVKLDGEAAGNYVLPTTGTEKTFSIAPATIDTLEWSGLKHDYDGTVKEPTITVAEGQVFGEDVVNVWYAMTSDGKQVPVKDDVYQSIDAGDYEVTPVALSNSNYVLAETAKAPKTMKIDPIEIMISWGEETEFTYDGEPHNATVNVYTVGGDAIPYTLTEDQINAGKYTAKVSFETSKNYTYDEADTTKAFTIAKAEPTLTVTMEGWTYKQTEKEPVVTGNEGEGTVTFEYFKDGTSIGATKPLTAGTYTVKASVAETANYTAKTSEAASFTIEKAPVAMTVSIQGWTAGQTANKPTTNLAGELDDSMVTFTYAPAGTTTYSATVPSTAGNYTVKANFPGNDNFLPAEATASFTIASSGGGGGGGFVPSGGGSSGGGGGAGYKLTLAATTNGTIGFEVPTGLKGRSTANGEITETIDRGTGITLVVKPADNYVVDKVSYKNANVSGDFTVEADGSIYFNMFNAATTVTATFKPKNDNDPSVGRLTISKYTNGYLTCSKGYGCLLNLFTDLDPTAWYHDGIHYCLENGIMQGFGTDEFLPFDVTTRAQVVTVLWNIAGHPIANNGTVFSDVKFTDWYYDAVMWAAANGIVDGYGDGKFGPNDKITHEQIAKIFYGYAKFYGYDVSDYMDISNLPGANKVSAWAVPYVSWAVAAGLCCGKDGDLSVIAAPEFATRAELAATILNFCTRIALKPVAKQ